MKLSKGTHKSLLRSLFYFPNPRKGQLGEPDFLEKKFALAKLFDASEALNKLEPTIRNVTDEEIVNYLKGRQVSPEEMEKLRKELKSTFFSDEEIEFTLSESIILKELFDKEEEWHTSKGPIVKELKDIFYPPKK